MSAIPQLILTKFTQIQSEIWPKVGLIFSEAAGDLFTFEQLAVSPLNGAQPTPEAGSSMMTIQYSFNGLAENPQVMAMPTDTIEGLVKFLSGTAPTEIDDAAVTALRPQMDAIVQGICTAIGGLRSETLIAGDLTVRYQNFVIPPNLERDQILRVDVAFSAGDFKGTISWFCDTETVHFILNETIHEEDPADVPFAQASPTEEAVTSFAEHGDNSSVDRLLDIPLEVSVELGRVKMLVKDVIELGTGSIVEIEKAAGEPVDVLVNGRPVARGEVVVIDDNFGIRITEILNPMDRLNRLSEVA